MPAMPPENTAGTELREQIAAAIATGRDLGPGFDAEVADSLADRLEEKNAETAREPRGRRPELRWWRREPTARERRAARTAGWGALGIAAAAWAAEVAPEGLPWGILAVVAVVLHVVRSWRS
ncbi:hypothetical protein GCM10027570_32330 [Streptomonospora sediminis]